MTWTIKKSTDKRGRIPVDCWNLFRDDELQGVTCWTEEHARTACAALNAPRFDWISVGDRLPDDGIEVLIYTKEESIYLAGFDGKAWIDDHGYICGRDSVTHWCDPVPPTTNTNEEEKNHD